MPPTLTGDDFPPLSEAIHSISSDQDLHTSAREMSEKGSDAQEEKVSVEEVVAPLKPGELAYGGDEALPPPPTLSAEEEKRLWRKVDMRLMPILTLMYLCSFLDRGNIGEYLLGIGWR